MFFAIKIMLIILMPVGLVFSLYGSWEMWGTKSLLTISTGKAKAKFYDYYREYEESTSITSMPDGSLRSDRGMSVASYPEFTYQAEDGSMKSVRESKVHVIEIFKPGEEIEIVLFDNYPPRIAGFYSLYMRDLVILIFGLGFMLIPALFLKFALPVLTSPERSEGASRFELFVNQSINNALNEKIGPFSVKSILVGFALFMGAAMIIALIAAVMPYLEQMRFGAGGRLIEAFEDRQFNKAREMIAKGSGINATNEFNQSPLLLALEAGQTDLARMLINAGADVNIKSKMLMTPLRQAAMSGDIEMVKILLSKGASPDAPPDEKTPFSDAMRNKHYEIARMLINGGIDLHKVYNEIEWKYTIGDLAVLYGNQELIELIKKKNGTFLGNPIPNR